MSDHPINGMERAARLGESLLTLDEAVRGYRDGAVWKPRQEAQLRESRRRRIVRAIRKRYLESRNDGGLYRLPEVRRVCIGGRWAYVTVQDYSGSPDDWTY